jgi:hypothetical protein
MKASTSTGGVKNLLLQHVEKIVLGVAVILVGVFLWSALGVKPIDAAKSPKTLEEAAKGESDRIARTDTLPPPPPTLNFVGGVAAGRERRSKSRPTRSRNGSTRRFSHPSSSVPTQSCCPPKT